MSHGSKAKDSQQGDQEKSSHPATRFIDHSYEPPIEAARRAGQHIKSAAGTAMVPAEQPICLAQMPA
jgi:hypothetical protein